MQYFKNRYKDFLIETQNLNNMNNDNVREQLILFAQFVQNDYYGNGITNAEIIVDNWLNSGQSLSVSGSCDHSIVDARNSVIQSGYMCIKCNALFRAHDH